MTDVSAPPCESWVSAAEDQDRGYQEPNLGTVLDLAARRGRLDMVKLPLDCNGLSHHWCKTGYDRAIQLARNAVYLAVADLKSQAPARTCHSHRDIGMSMATNQAQARRQKTQKMKRLPYSLMTMSCLKISGRTNSWILHLLADIRAT